MNNQDEILDENGVATEHQTIMQGGKIEEFADALGPVSYTHLTLPTIYSV